MAALTLAISLALVSATAAAPQRTDLAAGRPVTFAPLPNYALTAKGDTDETDLTDGRLSSRTDHKMWFEPQCVGFSYSGRCHFSVDLGRRCAIDEIVMRWQGGAPQAGVCFPVWVEALVSDDGQRWFSVGRFSHWNADDEQRYGLPRVAGQAWIHPLSFSHLDAAGRYVGIAFYGAGLSVIDEMDVYQGGSGLTDYHPDPAGERPFTTTGAQVHFHKPELLVTRDFATPNPIGLIVGSQPPKGDVRFVLELPRGVQLVGGKAGGQPAPTADDHGHYLFPLSPKANTTNKAWGRLYLTSSLPAGTTTQLRYGIQMGDGPPRWFHQPARIVDCPPTPQPERLTTTLGWWGLAETMEWPDGLIAARRLGLNTIPGFGHWTKYDDPETVDFLARVREQKFRVLNVDSPLHRMLAKHKRDKELYCQFADGTTGSKLCPSYRGPAYREELERVAHECAQLGADMLTADIEVWGWRGPVDAAKCTRCQEDFKRSGLEKLDQWQLQKGYEIWSDLASAVRARMKASGKPGIELGAYDFRPGMNYQNFWPFDRLYPKLIQNSEVSTYTPLYPYHLQLIGDEVRQDRQRLGRSDVLPWLTPGDAGVFPGEAFYHALLECYANGARGVLFWSSRVWDAEDLLAMARAIRVIAPLEDIVVDGELGEGIVTEPEVRVSSMRSKDRWFVLLSDYFGEVTGNVRVRVPVTRPSQVIDLESGQSIGAVGSATEAVTVSLENRRAAPLLIRP